MPTRRPLIGPLRHHPPPTEEEREWQDRAACLGVDPDLFFPEQGASTEEAKNICRKCPVQPECLAYALVHQEKHGIWGGMSERERRRLRKNLALQEKLKAGSGSGAA